MEYVLVVTLPALFLRNSSVAKILYNISVF